MNGESERQDELPSCEEIAAWEIRVMSIGHGVLSDREWRRLIDGYGALRADVAELQRKLDKAKQQRNELREDVERLRDALSLCAPYAPHDYACTIGKPANCPRCKADAALEQAK